MSKLPTKEDIIEQLKTVIDPEIDCDIWTMGLIYEIIIDDNGGVEIIHTLTSPACPLGPTIQDDIKKALTEIGCDDVEIELTFDPTWVPPPDLRAMLGLPG